jgi:hypothetical protein
MMTRKKASMDVVSSHTTMMAIDSVVYNATKVGENAATTSSKPHKQARCCSAVTSDNAAGGLESHKL